MTETTMMRRLPLIDHKLAKSIVSCWYCEMTMHGISAYSDGERIYCADCVEGFTHSLNVKQSTRIVQGWFRRNGLSGSLKSLLSLPSNDFTDALTVRFQAVCRASDIESGAYFRQVERNASRYSK